MKLSGYAYYIYEVTFGDLSLIIYEKLEKLIEHSLLMYVVLFGKHFLHFVIDETFSIVVG